MDLNFDIITDGLKKSWDVFVANVVAYIVGLLIMIIGTFFIITSAPAIYGFAYMAIKGSRGEKVEIGDALIGFKSISMFIRSWMFFIIPFVIFFAILILYILISIIFSSGFISAILGLIMFLVYVVLAIVFIPIVLYGMYIYIMTPSENAIYAYKESVNIFKANIVMTIVAIIVVWLLGIIPIIGGILGMLFTIYILKTLKPDLRDNA